MGLVLNRQSEDSATSVENQQRTPYSQFQYDAKHVQWFVIGAVQEYCEHVGVKDPQDVRRMELSYIELVMRYLTRRQKLDGRVSDFGCNLCMDAWKVFHPGHNYP